MLMTIILRHIRLSKKRKRKNRTNVTDPYVFVCLQI
jgi:hypothetical protein